MKEWLSSYDNAKMNSRRLLNALGGGSMLGSSSSKTLTRVNSTLLTLEPHAQRPVGRSFATNMASSQMETSDLELVLACRRGDQLAWEELVQRYQRLVYAIPRRAGLTDDESAEVFQEVFTTFFQRLNDIQEPEKLQAWLVTIARRKTWRTISKGHLWQHSNTNEGGSEFTAIPDDAPLPDEQLMILEEQHRIRTALLSLDERCQKLLQMLFYLPEPPSYGEIAASLGTSEGSIGPTRARCLEKLLRILNK